MFEFDSSNRPIEPHEYPDNDLADDWNEPDFATCPHCFAEIADDSVRCPICGDYISTRSDLWQGKSWWWVAVGLLGVAATLVALALH